MRLRSFAARQWSVLVVVAAGLLGGPWSSALADEKTADGGLLAGQIPAGEEKDWRFIDNGKIRVGVKLLSGAGIAWISQSNSNRNLVDHWDHGRLIQQSYYGAEDGSRWAEKPWRWNPVQGGDYRGHPARVLAIDVNDRSLHAKTLPKNWAGGEDVTDAVMEQWITLEDDVAHVRYRFHYSGEVIHPMRPQEIPAVFMPSDLETLVLYDSGSPWSGGDLSRSQPGWPNEGRKMAENWAAYVDDQDFGLGVYVPIAEELTCYRFSKPGNPGACSYFAPITRFAVTPGMDFQYDLYLSIGTSDQIRERFHGIRKRRGETASTD